LISYQLDGSQSFGGTLDQSKDFQNIQNIFPLNTKQTFTEKEANSLVSLLLSMTKTAKNTINVLNSRIQCNQSNQQKVLELQDEINEIIRRWSDKVNRLGFIPVALWKVKIPSQTGTPYVWEFPHDHLQ
jgi:hypothetical protein